MGTKRTLAEVNPGLVAEWHPSKNESLSPGDVAPFSHKKVWWLGTCGHEFESEVASRTIGRGCPICSGQSVLAGFNDLATTRPDLVAEWHPNKNLPLLPTSVTSGSTAKKIWWLGKCGHEWQATPAARSRGRSCPICAGQSVLAGFNDLATTRPDLVAEWHPNKNFPLLPTSVTSGSTAKKIWWLGKCGHEWQATPAGRSMGQGCPTCSNKKVVSGVNDMATTHPVLAGEFDYENNGPLNPKNLIAGTNKKLMWICPSGHSYSVSGAKRAVRGDGCPICSRKKLVAGINDLESTNPKLAETWGDSNSSPPSSVTGGSSKKVFWKCPMGHQEYLAAPKNRARGQGCPVCQNKVVQTGMTDLATIFPSLVTEWDYMKNSEKPNEVAPFSHKKFFWICVTHGSYLSTVAHRANGRGCPSCSTTGYDPSKPGLFYFIENTPLGAKKFGITNIDSREDRLAGFKKLGWIVLLKIESSDGREIASLEKSIFNWVRNDLHLPVYLSKQDIGKIGGWTETLSADGLDTNVGISRVRTEFERIRNEKPYK